MSLVTIISELWRFFKQNIIKIIIGAIVVALAAMGVKYYLNQQPTAIESAESMTASAEPTEEELAEQQNSYDYLTQVYSQEAAEFDVVILNDLGETFQNSYLLDEYLSTEAVVNDIEEETGLSFYKWYESEQNLGLIKTSGYRGGLAAAPDSASGVITFRFQVGQSGEENLEIANAYADLLLNEGIPLTENLDINLVNPVELVDSNAVTTPKFEGVIPTDETFEALTGQVKPTGISIIVYGVLGFVVGLILMTGLLFIIQLFKKRITYAFDYTWDIDDAHVIYERADDKNGLASLVYSPAIADRLILAADQEMAEQLKSQSSNQQLEHMTVTDELKDVTSLPAEIVMLVHSQQTDKTWYKEQYKMASLYNVPIKIILVV